MTLQTIRYAPNKRWHFPELIKPQKGNPTTIAQLLECILGKTCSELGYQGDGTGFNNTDVNDIINKLGILWSGYDP